ncbi:MAG: protein kinase [Deltaproteobacteria bacterium]|nr:protein kinase [Deltaproteobacteria bacterium]
MRKGPARRVVLDALRRVGPDPDVQCPDEAELVGFLQREATPDRVRDLENHFGDCDECRKLVFALASEPAALPTSPRAERSRAHSRDLLAVGERLGRFEIEAQIATGGMGLIYRAYDPTLKRAVALKLLQTGLSAADAPARLLREAQGLAQLEHPNVVTVFEAGLYAGEVFIAMELIDGVSLERWLAERPRGWRQVVKVMEAAGRGLAAAHVAGLIHRDFKPANVMISSDGRVKVVDFGLARTITQSARALSTAAAEPDRSAAIGVDDRLTRTGQLLGTPAYSAPEQLVGGDVDRSSDVFSFCVTFVEAVFGRRPFAADTAGALLDRMRAGPDLPRTPRIPARVRAMLRRGLAFHQADRLSSLDELLELLSREPTRRRARRIAIGATAVAAAAVFATIGMQSNEAACTSSRSQLDEVWSPARRTRVRDAILATKVPFAAETWQRVESALDSYVDRWAAMHLETCEATAVHHTQSAELLDQRMACLGNRRADLEATLTTLAETDDKMVREALRVVGGMPSLVSCTDATGLLSLAPMPTAPGLVAQLEGLRAEIARATARYRAGDLPRALEIASGAASTALRLDYKPAVAEALHARADIETAMGAAAARESYEAAVVAAAASGHREVEARSLADLAVITVGATSDNRIAPAYAGHAVAISERMGANPLLQAEVRYANAMVHAGIDHKVVVSNLELGLRQLDLAARFDPDAAELLRIQFEEMLANLEPTAGSGLPSLKKVLAHAEQVYGPNHPALAAILETMTTYAMDAGALDEGRGYATRIAKLLDRYPGRGAALLRIDARIEQDPTRRQALLEQLVSELEVSHGPNSQIVASALDDLASALAERHHYKEAAPYIDRSIRIWQAGQNHEALIVALTTKAQIYSSLDDLETSAAAAEQAYEVATRSNVRDTTRTMAGLLLADLHFQQQRFASALGLFEQYGPLVRRMLGADPALVLLDFYVAACEWELQRDRPKAMQRARAAERAYRALPDADPDSLDVMRRWFARRPR